MFRRTTKDVEGSKSSAERGKVLKGQKVQQSNDSASPAIWASVLHPVSVLRDRPGCLCPVETTNHQHISELDPGVCPALSIFEHVTLPLTYRFIYVSTFIHVYSGTCMYVHTHRLAHANI